MKTEQFVVTSDTLHHSDRYHVERCAWLDAVFVHRHADKSQHMIERHKSLGFVCELGNAKRKLKRDRICDKWLEAK